MSDLKIFEHFWQSQEEDFSKVGEALDRVNYKDPVTAMAQLCKDKHNLKALMAAKVTLVCREAYDRSNKALLHNSDIPNWSKDNYCWFLLICPQESGSSRWLLFDQMIITFTNDDYDELQIVLGSKYENNFVLTCPEKHRMAYIKHDISNEDVKNAWVVGVRLRHLQQMWSLHDDYVRDPSQLQNLMLSAYHILKNSRHRPVSELEYILEDQMKEQLRNLDDFDDIWSSTSTLLDADDPNGYRKSGEFRLMIAENNCFQDFMLGFYHIVQSMFKTIQQRNCVVDKATKKSIPAHSVGIIEFIQDKLLILIGDTSILKKWILSIGCAIVSNLCLIYKAYVKMTQDDTGDRLVDVKVNVVAMISSRISDIVIMNQPLKSQVLDKCLQFIGGKKMTDVKKKAEKAIIRTLSIASNAAFVQMSPMLFEQHTCLMGCSNAYKDVHDMIKSNVMNMINRSNPEAAKQFFSDRVPPLTVLLTQRMNYERRFRDPPRSPVRSRVAEGTEVSEDRRSPVLPRSPSDALGRSPPTSSGTRVTSHRHGPPSEPLKKEPSVQWEPEVVIDQDD